MSAPRIIYTSGEPAGIGMDLILLLAQDQVLSDIVCVADPALLQQRAELLGLHVELIDYPQAAQNRQQLCVLPIEFDDAIAPGKPSVNNATTLLKMLDVAIDGCLQNRFDCMVTGPLNKAIINEAGIPFSGHTEYLAERCDAGQPVMLLASDTLKVALITTHLPLSQVSKAITADKIKRVCRVAYAALIRDFAISKPVLAVCGLNPHAGEGGHLGQEEIEIINPALQELRQEGLQILGTLPADTAFTPSIVQQADIVIAMYHDQGLPVLKSHGFGAAANITLGLPITRTSVDHGTAFDLAGTGNIDTGSLHTAIANARQIAANRL